MGDHYFAGMFPFVVMNSNGNVLSFTNNIGQILEMIPEDIKIIPGQGSLSTRDDLLAYHNMLRDSIAFVKSNIDKGLSLEEIQKKDLPCHLKHGKPVSLNKMLDPVYLQKYKKLKISIT